MASPTQKKSIRNKIAWILILTSGITLFFSTSAFVVQESLNFRNKLISDLEVISQIISTNLVPALEFNDPKTAREAIRGVRYYPSIMVLAVYDESGKRFAYYTREGVTATPLMETRRQIPGSHSEGPHLILFQKIEGASGSLGHLYIRSDFSEFKVHFLTLMLISVIIFSLSFLLLLLLSRRFAKIISGPILSLANSVHALTAGDFSRRVTVTSEDELGDLAHAFNKMLLTLEQTTVSKDYVDSIVSSMNEALVVLNPAGRIEFVNKALLQFLGYSEKEILGKSAGVFFLAGEQSATELLQEIAEKGTLTKYNMFYKAKHGEPIPIALAGSLLEHTRSQQGGYLLVSTDIRELNKRTEELARSNKELEQFAYVASHDLQEPLRMVGSYVELLARRYKGKLDKDADEFIAFAVDGANRMKGLIQDLLAYSRVDTRAGTFKPVDCKLILDCVSSDLKMLIQETGAVFTVDTSLPTITADASQLVQVLENLVNNAIKFRKDSVPVQVHIRVKQSENSWVFSIEDNGIGIKKEFFERIFVIFQRLHHRDKYPGTGIGLAVCKRIVERHHGKIWLDSEEGVGTTFYFTIPTNLGGMNGSLEEHTEAN